MQNPISPDRPRNPTSWRRKIPTGLAGAAFWLGVWFVVLFVRHWIPGAFGTFLGIMQIFVGLALVAVAGPLIWQLVRKYMLWSLRNKLVLTYLLIGLAPVILFVTLVSVVAYVAAGQFAIHLADSRLQSELGQMSIENEHRAGRIAQDLEQQPAGSLEASTGLIADSERAIALELPRMRLHREMMGFLNGVPVKFNSGPRGKAPFGLPPWATELNGDHYSGMVLDGNDLFLVALQQQRLKDGRIFTLMSSLPVDGPVLTIVAEGLGHASLLPVRAGNSSNEAKEANSAVAGEADQRSLAASGSKPNTKTPAAPEKDSRATRRSWIVGGTEPPSVNVVDVPVSFTSTLPITDWDTGRPDSVFFAVESRPSLLYNQLFGASLSGIVTNVLRIAIVSLCVIFAIIELLALWMAIRLSRTITASVADLYSATQHIDRGDLDYRIGVQRTDQLAELSRSFNTMAGSLKRLLEEQKEKERLQNEISIAQEVQANLFPLHAQGLDTLELHGVCRPARSVSGDYYDFLVFHEEAHAGMVTRRETGVGIAIGDISGKGISAALLMATLHSAVRAYRFASEELVYSESSVAGSNGQ